MSKQPPIDMNETITLTCVFCGRSETGKRRDIWRKDEWDWYTGYVSGRMEFCPSCVKTRADEISARIEAACKEYPKPTSASKQSRIAELEAELTSANRALEMRNNALEEARQEIEVLKAGYEHLNYELPQRGQNGSLTILKKLGPPCP